MLEENVDRVKSIAADLRDAFCDLEAAKYGRDGVRLARKQKPRPGPQSPANDEAVSLWCELSENLAELVRDLRDGIEPGRRLPADPLVLCDWLGFNAAMVAEIDWLDDLYVELCGMVRAIDRKVGRIGPRPVPVVEPRQWGPAICQRLAGMGHRVTPTTLRKWAERSASTPAVISVEMVDGKAKYLLTEVLSYVVWRESKVA